MFIEMSCSCGASFQSEAENNESVALMWGHRFVNAHQGCGFMSHAKDEYEEKTKRYDITYKEQRENEL